MNTIKPLKETKYNGDYWYTMLAQYAIYKSKVSL